MSTTDSERRTNDRVEAIVLVELESGRMGVTRNVSGTGLLIATRSCFLEGDRLELTIHATGGAVHATARVIRVDQTPPEDTWRYRVAVQLETPLPEAVIQHGTETAARFIGRSSRPPPM